MGYFDKAREYKRVACYSEYMSLGGVLVYGGTDKKACDLKYEPLGGIPYPILKICVIHIWVLSFGVEHVLYTGTSDMYSIV